MCSGLVRLGGQFRSRLILLPRRRAGAAQWQRGLQPELGELLGKRDYPSDLFRKPMRHDQIVPQRLWDSRGEIMARSALQNTLFISNPVAQMSIIIHSPRGVR